MNVHEDARRTAYYDLFPELPGQVNLYIVNPGQRTAWHRHQRQTDVFRVIRGMMQFGFFGGTQKPIYVPSNNLAPVTIYPGLWHGYENIGDEPAYLLMHCSQQYDPSDEERMSEDVVPWLPI